MMDTREALCALGLVLWITSASAEFAQAQTSPSPTEKLQQEFTDPLTVLPQVFSRDSYAPANFGTHVQTNSAVLRAIIPRIPPNSLLPFDQPIRPTFSLGTVPSSRGSTRTEFGDTQLFDLAFLPWPAKKTGIKLALGPTFVFPTATSKSAGQGAWQAGPAFAAGYTGVPWFVAGFLFQNPISFALHVESPLSSEYD